MFEKCCCKWQVGYAGNLEWIVVSNNHPLYASIDAKECPVANREEYISADGALCTSYDASGAIS